MQKVYVFMFCSALLFACAGGSGDTNSGNEKKEDPAKKHVDEGKGVGEFKDVALNNPLNTDMVAKGKAIYDMKCSACHKLTETRVVGPGWKGVTTRRKPEWIMNMTTNVEVMLEKDPAAQAMLKECLVRMPNQNLTAGDARDVLEFMLANDGATAPK